MKLHPSRKMLSLAGFLGLMITGAAAAPAAADTPSLQSLLGTPTSTSACSAPAFSQPFLAAKDPNFYALLPGETDGNFGGSGWTLTDGAGIVETTLADGRTGSVLDLPSGSTAISPPICVTSQYPTARTYIQDVTGAAGVFVYVSYAGTGGWGTPRNTGQVHGEHDSWTLSTPVNIQPGRQPGWQLVRFVLVAGGNHSEFRLYDLYVDPRMTF